MGRHFRSALLGSGAAVRYNGQNEQRLERPHVMILWGWVFNWHCKASTAVIARLPPPWRSWAGRISLFTNCAGSSHGHLLGSQSIAGLPVESRQTELHDDALGGVHTHTHQQAKGGTTARHPYDEGYMNEGARYGAIGRSQKSIKSTLSRLMRAPGFCCLRLLRFNRGVRGVAVAGCAAA